MRAPARTLVSALSIGALAWALAGCAGGSEAEDTGASEGSAASADATPSTSPGTDAAPGGTRAGCEPGGDARTRAFLERLKTGMGERGSVHVAMRMTGPVGSSAAGDTTYGPEGSEARLTMSLPDMGGARMGGARMRMVVADGATYLALPGITPPGKWFELPEDSTLVQSMGGSAGLSPTDSFAGFEAGLKGVAPHGRTQIAGEATERYRLRVDAACATEAMDMGPVAGLPDTLVYDVWLDGQDRMRRLRYELGGSRLTLDLTRWGEPVTIDAPAEKDLVEAPPGI